MTTAADATSARLAVIGTGLLGGSFAAAMRRRGLAARIVGHSSGRDADRARTLGLVDEVAATPEAAVAGADLVLLAAPVSVNAELIERLAGVLAPGALMTDVSSVKAPIVAAAGRHLADRLPDFVPSHPIAGSERAGPDAADPDLFERRLVVLSPLAVSRASQVSRLDTLWRALGARTRRLDPDAHDRIYALVSHWPHALAFALAAAVADEGAGEFAGQGLLDLTRTAASSPELWADILLQNAAQALAAADRVDREADAIRAALRASDRAALIDLFRRAADWRRAADPDPPRP